MTFYSLSALGLVLSLASACAPTQSAGTDGPPVDLRASAARFYVAYGDAVRAGRGDALAQFYAPTGALRVIDGQARHATRAGLDSVYRGGWQGPAFFAWDSLAFDSVDTEHVLVTGFFRWQTRSAPDTGRYIYAALLQAVDSGLAIRFEHETPAGR